MLRGANRRIRLTGLPAKGSPFLRRKPPSGEEAFVRTHRALAACSALILSAVIAACGGGDVDPGTPLPSTMQTGPVAVADATTALPDRWYARGAIMEINVRAYHDSDGDGVGDLNGVTAKLDYLQDLGITGIWLMPVNKTGDHDSGYIITDHRDIETEYGSLADFRRLVDEAHRRGIGVIIDYVMNHSASDDPLFVNAASSFGATYRNWYVWQTDHPQGWQNFGGGDPWYRTPRGYYYGLFRQDMPDFNLRNRDVVEYHKNNLRFWLNLGVDGFRFDAIETFIENGPDAAFAQPENYALMREMRQTIDAYANRYIVCESPGTPAAAASDSACGSAFAFGLQTLMRQAARGDGNAPAQLAAALAQLPQDRMATFLGNHDLFAGQRLMDEFGGDETSYRLAAATLLTLPGIPFVYYGEEVGMRGMPVSGSDPASDWPLRGPMSWDDQPTVTRNTRIGPYGNYFAPAPNIATHNVALASAEANSLWRFYRTLLTLRQQSPALRGGSYRLLQATSHSLAYERRSADESVVVVLNYGNADEALSLAVLPPGLAYTSVAGAPATTATTLQVPADGSAATLTAPARSVQVFKGALR